VSTHSKVDPTTLGWVKNEIDEALKQARLALESFAENPADKTRLRFCLTHLHQVVGTLLMVELDGAAMLAKEIEALAQAILDDKADAGDATLEALTRGIIMLPDYLARLQAGSPDLPLHQLALLNELRAAHGAEPVKPVDLFTPDLTVRPPPRSDATARRNDADFTDLARELRPRYQNALLGWLRDSGSRDPLEDIRGMFEQLQAGAAQGFAEQLFWVAGGFTEALADGGIESDGERKKFFARLDQLIKKFVDGAERNQLRKSCEELTRGMLLELGQATSGGARVTQLKQAFSLDAALGRTEQGLDLPSPEVLKSVAEALGKEVESAQDLLTAYFDSASRDPQLIDKLVDELHKMGGILDMLGASTFKQLTDELTAAGRALREGRVANPESASMPMAQALLLIENSAQDIQHSATGWRSQMDATIRALHALHAPGDDAPPAAGGIEVSDAELSETDFQQLAGVVGEEISVNLAKIEEAIESFAADSGKQQVLDPVPGLLNQILGALQILGQDQAGELVQETRSHIEAIREGALTADSALLDGLAVCIGTIGAYVEGLRGGRTNLEGLIESARREMDAALRRQHGTTDPQALLDSIGASLNAWLEHDEPAAHATLQTDLAVVAQLAREQGQDKIERIAGEMNRLTSLLQDDPEARTAEAVNTLRQSHEALAALVQRHLQPAPPAAPRPAPVAPGVVPAAAPSPPVAAAASGSERARVAAAQAEEADPEIMQIFIEDASDVYRNIRKEFATFRANPEDNNALLELRRGYHTIKGSGRMVGAGEIAEMAWSVESMLNKLRDGKIRHSPELVQVLEQAEAVVPVMIEDLSQGRESSVDVSALRAAADAIAQGQSPGHMAVVPAPSSAKVPAPAVVAETEPAGTAVETELPSLDSTLLEIFASEASGHLATLRNEAAAIRANGVGLVPDAMFRATHTLLGNARSLSIAMMSEACLEVEKLLQTLRSQNLPLDETQLEMVETLESTVGDLVEALKRGESHAGELKPRFARIARRAHDINAGLQGVEVQSPVAPAAMPAAAPAPQPPPAPAPKREAARGATPPASPVAAADTPVTEQLDTELLEIFMEEAVDILGTIDATLTRWRANPGDRDAVHELKRELHTLKGGARMAGAMTMGTLAHNTESLLRQIEEGQLRAAGTVLDTLDEAHDALVSMLDSLRAGVPVPGAQGLNARLTALATGQPLPEIVRSAAPTAMDEAAAAVSAPVETGEVETPVSPSMPASVPVEAADAASLLRGPRLHPEVESPTSAQAAPSVNETGDAGRDSDSSRASIDERREPEEAAAPAWPEPMERRGQIRVNTGLLNQLVNFAGEVSISRARMEQQIYGFRDNMAELTRNVIRFRDQIRDLEIQSESQILYRTDAAGNAAGAGADFDPLEFDRFSRLQQLSRQLAESLHDLATIQGNLGNFVGEAEAVLQQQARLNTELQEGLMRTRMVGFGTQAGRLRHSVRTTAREIGKRVDLELQGVDVEVDRTVLDRMIGPFEHMIRNSIDHGIESADVRVRAGKPAEGRITIAVAQEGAEIVINFSDDGAGLNLPAIRAKAVERGLLDAGASVTDDELIQFILQPGFSTAAKVTQVSGRGVGMDVVHSEVKQLGGTMSVSTERGQGTSFVIRLPLTLSITQALMLYIGDQQLAMPLSSVVNIVEFPVERLNELSVGKNPLLNHNDQVYPFMHLGQRLGLPSTPRNGKKVPVLLVRTGAREVAMQVDGLGGTREIVIKTLGPQLAEIKGLAGATILGDGRVVLILDAPGLWIREDTLHVEHRAPAKPKAEARERPLIMVVDDSLTVRKITSKHLTKRGMEVITAKDGLDAVEQLRDRVPDLMLVDIEMPRMDGYELTTRVRGDERLKHVPIIMITSRAGAKHKQRAIELGVDSYMSKPYQEEDLFGNIESLLRQGRAG
jgi:chemosensory pili system protein ChpA (sensor histidine kinase/response regulator)